MPEPSNVQPATTPPSTSIDAAALQQFMRLMAEGNRQMIQDAVIAAVGEMRKPSPEDAAKEAARLERLKNRQINSAKAGEQIDAQIKAQQTGCAHQKPNGKHTFGGQIYSDGWAVVRCQRCTKEWRVRPLPQHAQNGNVLNLNEVQGLTATHLDNWVKQSPQIDATLAKAQAHIAKAGAITQRTAEKVSVGA